MSNCPRCHRPLVRSATMVSDAIVLGCRHCNQFTVEGCDRWVSGGAGLRESLAILAGNVKTEKDVHKEMMESDIRDPRWEQIGEWI